MLYGSQVYRTMATVLPTLTIVIEKLFVSDLSTVVYCAWRDARNTDKKQINLDNFSNKSRFLQLISGDGVRQIFVTRTFHSRESVVSIDLHHGNNVNDAVNSHTASASIKWIKAGGGQIIPVECIRFDESRARRHVECWRIPGYWLRCQIDSRPVGDFICDCCGHYRIFGRFVINARRSHQRRSL